jgi:uncharacterized protein
MMARNACVLAVFGVAALGAFAQEADPGATAADSVQFQWEVRIPMRDGVRLSAMLYRPLEKGGRLPCIFFLTPYIAQGAHDRAMYFASRGYVFLAVDTRGRGNSDGEFTPLLQEAKDGYDIVEWLAQQPWCNGKVAMWGGSYTGYDQWATAKELPPHLATIVPVAAVGPGIDFPMLNNLFYTYDPRWLMIVRGRALQDKIFADGGFWSALTRRWFAAHAPFNELDTYLGDPSPIFQTWIAHPTQDTYWDNHRPTPDQYTALSIPILSITGHYDDDQPGALAYYKEHMRYGNEQAKPRHYLIIGPWDHDGTRTPKKEVGGVEFGDASLLNMNELQKAWYDWTLKSGPKPDFLKDKVAFYVAGEEAWRYAPTLAGATARMETWYLDSENGRAVDVLASGDLRTDRSGTGAPDLYVYDPLDLGSMDYESRPEVWSPSYKGYIDQRPVLMSSGRQLAYHTPAFGRDADIAGFFKLSAYIALDQPDTDFDVRIYEIRSDGSSIFLARDLMRARYRNSLREEMLVKPGVIERYDFQHFNFTARRIAKGSRLRLVIGPVNTLMMEKNYNTGGVVGAESGKDARKVTVMLYHDKTRPSALYVPIAAASSVQEAKKNRKK